MNDKPSAGGFSQSPGDPAGLEAQKARERHEEQLARTFAMASQVSSLAILEFFSGAAYLDISPKVTGGYTVHFRRDIQQKKE